MASVTSFACCKIPWEGLVNGRKGVGGLWVSTQRVGGGRGGSVIYFYPYLSSKEQWDLWVRFLWELLRSTLG